MQENKTIRKVYRNRRRGLCVASLLLAMAASTSCDEQSSPSIPTTTQVVDNSAAAYAALSNALERCEDANEACLNGAGSDSSARERCAREAASCRAEAEPIERRAESTLERETRWCHKACTDDDAGPGGTDDADGGTGDLDECIDKHAPRLPRCLRGLVTCVNDAGLFRRDATRGEIRDCVAEAHECIRERLSELRDRKRGHGHGRDAGPPAAGSGGAEAGSGGTGGVDDAGVSPARESRRGFRPFWRR